MKYSDSVNFSRLNWPSPCCLNRPALWLAASVWKSRLNFFLFYGYTSQPTPLDIFSYFLWFSQAVPVRCQWKSSQTEPKRGKLTIQKDNRMVIACSKRITSGIHTFCTRLQAIKGCDIKSPILSRQDSAWSPSYFVKKDSYGPLLLWFLGSRY